VTMGPVQLMVIGFEGDQFITKLLDELQVFRGQRGIRLLDLLFVRKDARGGLKLIESLAAPAGGFACQDVPKGSGDFVPGSIVRGLIGMGTSGHISAFLGARAGVMCVAQNDSGLSLGDVRDIARGIARNSSAALLLIEHHWVVSFKEALLQADGVLLAQGLVHPAALVRMSAELAAAEAAY
jgi:uncharacterized membrane protein